MDSNQRMIICSSAWALIGGVVACTGCMNSQAIFNAEEPFPHDPACKAKSEIAPRPWVELHDILDLERG